MVQGNGKWSGLGREAGECWRFGRHWIRYLAHGRRAGATGLADFAAGDHFFGSVQVPRELAAFGNIIACGSGNVKLFVAASRSAMDVPVRSLLATTAKLFLVAAERTIWA